MNTYKKLLLGLGVASLLALPAFIFAQKVFADVNNITKADWQSATYRVTQTWNCGGKVVPEIVLVSDIDGVSGSYPFIDKKCDSTFNLYYFGSGDFVCNQSNLQSDNSFGIKVTAGPKPFPSGGDRKSTRLNSSHHSISYAVFCLKKK